MRHHLLAVATAIGLCAGSTANAQDTIKIGVTVSQSGPAASLGLPEANEIKLAPTEIGGVKVQFIILDDASDPTKAVANTRKLIAEDKVDAIIGPSITPASLAMVDVVGEAKVPNVSMVASAAVVAPMDDKRKWIFKVPQNDSLMAAAIVDHMAKAGVKTVGYIGFSDAYGDGWIKAMTPLLQAKGIKVAAEERYARNDTSVVGQTLKIISANPDAVLVGAAGTPAALPQKSLREKGYKGVIYQTHGAANNDFLRVVGKDGEGTIMPTGPVLVASQLPDTNPSKKVGVAFTAAYEKAYGAGSVSTFAAHAHDAVTVVTAAIPIALKKAKPGTPEFRQALRDAIEGLKDLPMAHGIVTYTPTDHVGQDERARVMVTVKDGKWVLLP